MHWSSKLNPLNIIGTPSPTKPKTLQDASGMATRRPLELLNDDELPPRLPMARGVLGDGLASSTSSTASFSVDQSRTHRLPSRQPGTPISKKDRSIPGSAVRSILREPNTPGTGQSVRFFSRDAFKVISPRASTASSPANSPYPVQDFQLPEPEELEEDEPVQQSMEKSDERSRSASLVLAEEGEQATNLFDMSLDMPPIPPAQDASNMLSDDAIEVPESENGRSDAQSHDSIAEEVRKAVDQSSFMPAFPGMLPKTPVKKRSSLEEDSVANTTTYWTPRSLFPFFRASPSTPPTTETPITPTATTATSSDVNLGVYLQLLSTLREELDLQKKMNKQIELDLDNRDQLVEILCMRVENAETELEEWRKDGEEQEKAVALLKKQLLSLERMCIKLQGMDFRFDGIANVDESMKSSASIEDEASSQALKTLKERIRALEDEKRDLRERLRNGEDDNSDIVGLIDERNELREKVAALEEVDNLQRKEIDDLQRKLKEAVNDAPKTNDQMRFLQEELEAQWERTEKAEEELTKLRNQNSELKASVTKLQEGERSEDINAELADQLNEMMASQQALEEERDQISEELEASRKQVEDLVTSHSELQRKLEQTEQELAFSAEKVERLQTGLSSRDRELQAITTDHQTQFSEMESLRGKLLSADKDHARKLSDAKRQIDELRMQLDITSESSNRIVQETAERDVYLAALEEKANTRLDECERLRRRVHLLEQESAAREVIFVELKREKERVKDDNLNLNIALDSKQQELEMIKRKLGVKGTGGATPAPNRPKNAPRESSIFGVTPRPLTGFNKTVSETPATVKVPPSIFSSSVSSSVRTSNDGAFGPKTITRPRESVGSPTTNINVFTRPASAAFTRSSGTTTTATRFGLGGIGIDGLEEEEEKENLAPLRTSRRPNLMVNA